MAHCTMKAGRRHRVRGGKSRKSRKAGRVSRRPKGGFGAGDSRDSW